MSYLKHPRLALWNRDDRGDYVADLNGWSLRVKWIPVTHRLRGAFLWEAKQPGFSPIESRRTFEEPEMAMAAAEDVALPNNQPGRAIDRAGDSLM